MLYEVITNLVGKGTFKGSDNTTPFVGEKNKLHTEEEVRFETILPKNLKSTVVKALIKAHPYEEVAYDFVITSYSIHYTKLYESLFPVPHGKDAQIPSRYQRAY